MICGSGGSKSRLAKAAGAEPAGQMRDEKLHAVVARSTFPSEKVQNTWVSEHVWKLRCRKSARLCGPKHISKWKRTKHLSVGPSWDVEKVHAVVARSTFRSQNAQNTPLSDHFWKLRCRKKCTPLWREAHFEVKMLKTPGVRTPFGGSDVVSRGRRKGLCTSSEVSKTWGFCSISKNDGRHGTFEEDLQRCIFRGRRSTKDMFMRDVRRSGRWFPETGCILEMCRFAKMILRDRCSTSYDLASIFRGRRSTLDRWTGKIANALVRGCQLCTQLSIFEGSLAEFFCFWCLDLRKMRKSRRIASFRMLSSSKNEDVSQNCFVLDVVMFKH